MAEPMMGGGLQGKGGMHDDQSLYDEPETSEEAKKEETEGEEESAVVVPRSSLPAGSKVGDVISFRITDDYGDELGLAPESGKSSSSKPASTADTDQSNQEIDSMNEEAYS